MFFKIRNSNNSFAIHNDSWHDETSISSSHILISGHFLLLSVARFQKNNVMQRQYYRNIAPDGGSIAGAMQYLYAIFLGSSWQCPLFPQRIGWAIQFYNVYVFTTLYTMVFSWFYKHIVFIRKVHLLQFFNFLQHHVVHTVFVFAEYPLCFYANFHISSL